MIDIIIRINFMHHHRISNNKQIQSMIVILIPRIYISIKGCCSAFNFSATNKYIDRHLVAMFAVRLFVKDNALDLHQRGGFIESTICNWQGQKWGIGFWNLSWNNEICTFSKPEGVEVSFILKKKRKFWRYLYLFFKNDANLFIRFTIE